MELEITWKHTLTIWWAFVWRYFLATFIIGFIIGFIGALLGGESQTTQWISSIVTGIVGLAISIMLFKWILRKDFGEFRLVLLTKQKK